jgi:hypothetical protein
MAALEQARAVLDQATTRFWKIKDDPAVPYDVVYQLHVAYQKASREVVELESRIMSQAIASRPEDLAELKAIRDTLAQDADNRVVIEGVLRLAVLIAGM